MAVAIHGDPSPSVRAPSGRANELTSTVGPRLHWIDWLRVAAIAGVLVYHTLRPFNTDGWHVKNGETSDVLNVVTTFVGSFGLAVLFLLAGAGVRFALHRRTWQAFIRERAARLLVPFVAGTLLLSPVQGLIEATHKAAAANPATDLIGWWSVAIGWATDDGFSPSVFGIGYHLWFLGFLFSISLVALPLCIWLMGDRGRASIHAMARRFTWPGASLVFVVPIFALMGIGSALGTSEHDWLEFFWYSAYFMIGFVLFSDDLFIAAVRRDATWAAVVAVVATGLTVAGIPAPLATIGDQRGLTALAMGGLFAAQGWAWTLVVVNVGLRTARLQRPVAARVGEAVLPVYVIHQPVILAVAFFVVQWPLAILPKWLTVFGISAVVTISMVELALRTPVTRALLGARRQPTARPPATVAGASTIQPLAASGSARPHHARPG